LSEITRKDSPSSNSKSANKVRVAGGVAADRKIVMGISAQRFRRSRIDPIVQAQGELHAATWDAIGSEAGRTLPRVDVFRFTAESGHRGIRSACPFCAKTQASRHSLDHLIGAHD